ncbi:MAG: hypothetical protein LBT89_04385 [Planctomycetaceae bacterium]|jgi:IS1 family transposase|nr:hypothetical protein [Planctomycetaceae bacterium]
MAFVFGDRSAETGRKLWDKIQGIQIDKVASDYWSACEDFVLPEKHLQRITKCYSKSEDND